MPQSLDCIYLHLVFSTLNREPWFTGVHLSEMHAYLSGVSRELGAPTLRVGGVADHVHLLARFPRTITVAKWVEGLKSNSSKWFKKSSETQDHAGFAWQQGYGVFSVSPSHVDSLVNYIKGQAEHHKKETFQDEYRRLLRKYGMTVDERYMWG
ncbi:MAG: IS200/IS605 family transposase [Verrucomicrobia bacterium]|nr:IS200/IS605 family transposase [Verrucomicrobiota bacterium]MCH8512733.1 IS200/IS605 family transposase [Kiritimatiellia bacterium]